MYQGITPHKEKVVAPNIGSYAKIMYALYFDIRFHCLKQPDEKMNHWVGKYFYLKNKMYLDYAIYHFNSPLTSGQNGRHLAADSFRIIFVDEKFYNR